MLTEAYFKGLKALLIDEQVEFDYAIDASDCELDDGAVRGRHGYRASSNTATIDGTSGLPTSSIKGATKFTYTAPDLSGTHEYACLNGDRVALYINDRGDFGAPYPIVGGFPGSKPPSVVIAAGTPSTGSIGTDGVISGSNAYSMLYAASGTGTLASAELSVEAKKELIGAGAANIIETWSVRGSSATSWDTSPNFTRLVDFDFPAEAGQFVVSGSNAGSSPISATTKSKLRDFTAATDMLRVTHVVELQSSTSNLNRQRVKVTVTLANLSGALLSGVRYQRAFNANPAATAPNSAKNWRNNADATAFSIRCTAGGSEIAIGVDNTQVGAALWTKTSGGGENNLAQSGYGGGGAFNYVLLGAAGAATVRTRSASYCPQVGDTIVSTIADYTTAGAVTTIESGLGLGSSNDSAVLLMSPNYDIANGGSATFIFFYYIGGVLPSAGEIQFVGRYRPGTLSVTDARAIAVRGGAVNKVTDPASETATDGTPSNAGTVFAPTAKVSGAQLGKYFYLGDDEQNVAWQRMKPDYTLESLTPFPKLAGVGSTSSPTALIYNTLAGANVTVTGTGMAKTTNYLTSGWILGYSATKGSLGKLDVDLGAGTDMSAADWLLVYVSPLDRTQPGLYPIEISISEDNTTFYPIGTIQTTLRGGIGSPNAIYCNLRGLAGTNRDAVRYIRFKATNSEVESSIAVYGHVLIPAKPSFNPRRYYVVYRNSTTLQESVQSDVVSIITVPLTLATYPYLNANIGNYYYNNQSVTASPENKPQWVYNFRPESTISAPDVNDIVAANIVSGTSQLSAASADKIALYVETENGIRLVREITNPGVGVAYSITDNGGSSILANRKYKPGGTPPPCNAMAAVGGRIICGGDPANPARILISSFTPFGQDTDPFPQFPAIAVESADGHSFDIAPTAAEQVLWIGEGDKAAYIGTNEAMYVMTNLEPFSPIGNGSIPFRILQKGVLGRRAAWWSEDTCFWASHDGIYAAQRASWEEVSKSIRRLYREWLAPDSTTVVIYQDRKLIIICGTKFLRLDFVREGGVWTRGTIAHTIRHATRWRDPSGVYEQAMLYATDGFLYRWQPGKTVNDANRATSDAGTAIANWTYSTGFLVAPKPIRPQFTLLDLSGSIVASYYKTTSANPIKSKTFGTSGEHEYPYPPDMNGYKMRLGLTGANTAYVKRAMYQLEPIDRKGG